MSLPIDIFEACRSGNFEMVQNIVEQFPESVNMEDAKAFTPLILAVYNNHPDVVDYLLKNDANLEAGDAAGNTALMGVCFKGYKDIAKMLLNAGALVNHRNGQGATALTFAATFGHLQIAEMLLEKAADITVPDMRGKSPLDHARIQENWEMYDLLGKYENRVS